MKFNNKNIKLAIFDLDGTLIDSTSVWSDVDATFFKKRDQDIPSTYADEIAHVGLVAAAKLTKDKYFPNELEKDIIQEWHDLSLEAYATHIPLKNNVERLLEKYYKLGIHIALATANSKELYEPCLTRLGIKQYFEFN